MDHLQTKLNPKPAVLIISDRWGSPFQGGIPAAVRLLARLFNSLGFVIYCTVLKVTEEEYKDAKELNVTLVPPKLREPLEWEENDKPCRKWLLSHESYFENLKILAEQANIKIVVGFALATSAASHHIKDNVFATAKYYITNLWPCDNLPPSILGCSKEVLSKLVKVLQETHHKDADAVTSIDHQTFISFFGNLKRDTHFQILPSPEEKYFSSNPLNQSPEITRKQILSFFEEHDELKISAHINLTKAINKAAKTYHAVHQEQLKWVIHGVQSATEDEIIKALKPFGHLKIVPRPMFSSWSTENDLRCSHLVLIPPESPGINSLHLLISTLATGIPLLIAMDSPSHDFIKTYFPDYVGDMIVDMTTPKALGEKILHIFNNYQCSLKKAAAIKEIFKNETVTLIDDINRRFIAHVKEDPHFAHLLSPADNSNKSSSRDIQDSDTVEAKLNSADTSEVVEYEPSGNAGTSGDKTARVSDENPQMNVPNLGQERDDQNASNDISGSTDGGDAKNNMGKTSSSSTGHMTVRVTPTVIPEENQPVVQVTKKYKELQEVVKETPQQINGIHRCLTVEDISEGSIIYHVKCTTLDALNYLWHYYTSQKLQKLITSTTVTKKTLAIIGAVYLELQVTMDIEEYRQCKLELTRKDADNGVRSLLLMEIKESKEALEEYLSQIFRYRKCVRLEGQLCNMLQMVITMTDRVQHILYFGQEILALLGVTRYLTIDVSTEDQTIEALEEQLIKDGTQVQLPSDAADNVSLLARSLSPYTTTTDQVSHYLVEHLLALGQAAAQSKLNLEMTTLQQRLEDGQCKQSFWEKQMQEQQSELAKKEKMITELLSKKSRRTHADEQTSALFVSTIQNTKPSGQNITKTFSIISNFCQDRLRDVEVSGIYCTILSHAVSDDLKKAAETIHVTLIKAEEHEGSDLPQRVSWLHKHKTYYPTLKKLVDVKHVIGFIPMTKNVTIEIHDQLFPHAELHLLPLYFIPAVLFICTGWNNDELGLTGFHRTLVQDFCERKAKAGEDLKAYSTVLDVKISDDQKKDAESCGVTLIPAQRKEKADHRDDPPKLEWLLYHEICYPDLREVENVQYVIGYAPKTGRAAADIRRKLFPGAKLVFINHACPERNYLQAEEYSPFDFEEKMLQMASEADILFSIGPYIFDYFENAYRAEIQGRDLSEIPHEEILPRPDRCFWVKEPKEKLVIQHHILTYGQMDTQMAIEGCKSIAASIGTVANHRKAHYSSQPEWKIHGVSKQAGKTEQKFLADASESPYVYPKLKPGNSTKSLLTSLQQSHLCLPVPCYRDYSFYGLEAMAFGLPTAVNQDSHLAYFVMKYLEMHVDDCVVRIGEEKLSEKISQHLEETPVAFMKAKALKTALTNCEAITDSFVKFSSSLTRPVNKETQDSCQVQEEIGYDGKSGHTSMKRLPKPTTATEETGTQTTHGEVTDEEEAESSKATTTLSESIEIEQEQVALDEEMLQKRLKELEEQTHTLSVQLKQVQERKENEPKAAQRESQHGLKRRVQAVLADEDNCNEVKKVCKEKVGLDPTTQQPKQQSEGN